MTFFLKETGTNLRGGYFRMKTSYLNPFPLPKIEFNTLSEDRIRYATQLNQLNPETDRDRILELVQENLDSDRADVLHDYLAFLAREMLRSNREKQREMQDFGTWLQRQIGAEIDQLSNKTKLKNYLGDYQKQEPHLNFDEFLKTLNKNRKKLAIDPSEPKIQNLIAKEYQKSLDILLPIKTQLIATDTLIDAIVCKLYGLTDKAIANTA